MSGRTNIPDLEGYLVGIYSAPPKEDCQCRFGLRPIMAKSFIFIEWKIETIKIMNVVCFSVVQPKNTMR